MTLPGMVTRVDEVGGRKDILAVSVVNLTLDELQAPDQFLRLHDAQGRAGGPGNNRPRVRPVRGTRPDACPDTPVEESPSPDIPSEGYWNLVDGPSSRGWPTS